MIERAPSVIDLAWRTAYRIAFPLARLWWRLSGARHTGALVAVHVGPDLLLLRSSYRSTWNFPGGGIRRGETPEAAARRELAEEIGLTAAALIPAGTMSGRIEGRRDHVYFFDLRLDRLPPLHLDNREIIAARLVSPAERAAMKLTPPVAAYLQARATPSRQPPAS